MKVNIKNCLRYIYAILAVPLIVLLRFALMPLIGPGIPYVTLFPISVAVALLAGFGPALLTGVLSTILIDYLFIEPLYSLDFNVAGFSRMAVVVLTSAFVGYVGEALRAARAKAEQQALTLRNNQIDLNRAQAVSLTGSWRLDVLKDVLTWSDEVYRIFDVPKGTPLTYKSFLSFVHPDDKDFVDKKWEAVLTGENYDIEHRIVVGGQIKWVHEKAYLEFDKDGQLLGGFGICQDITERKKMEDALHQARDELEMRVQERTAQLAQQASLLDLADDAIIVRDMNGRITFWNSGATKTYDWTREQAIGNIAHELLKTEFPVLLEEIKADLIRKGQWEGELIHTRQDGRQIVETSRWALQRDKDGNPLHILEINRDITERKQTEARKQITNLLLELFVQKNSRQDYLDSVVEAIRNWSGCNCVGIRLLNSEGYIPYASYIGFSQEFLKLENMLSVHTDTCACMRVITGTAEHSDAAVMTSRSSFCCNNSAEFFNSLTEKEKALYRGNCVRHGFASIAVIPIRYRQQLLGAIHLADQREGMVGSEKVEFIETAAMLVGEAVHRFDTEAQLRQSEERYRQLVELSPDGIGVAVDEKITFINSAGVKLLGGKSPQEFIGRSIFHFVHPDYIKRSHRQLKYLQREKLSLPLRESRFVRLDGITFDVEVAATPLVYKEKSAAQIVFRDITARKAAEKEILTNQEKLRSLTAELVLAEERERRSVAMALHDSLGPILAFSKRELGTLRKSVSKKDADILKNIAENISIAIGQTRNLTFDLSPPALYTFGFEMAVAELAERFGEEQKLKIIFENTDELKPLTDHVKVLLYRSIREILINIAKHAQAKVVRIVLSRVDDKIKIVVKDDGKGFNVSSLGSSTGSSQGFGLFSVRERLTHIGGRIDIQSVGGRGTTVIMLAPLDIGQAEKEL